MSQKKLLFLFITFISIIALFSFMTSPFFDLRNFIVNELQYIKEDEIEDILSPYYGDNIWLIDSEKIKELILNKKYIRELSINKKIPDTIKIDIIERVPLGKINNNGKYLVFDKDGFILEEGSLKTRAKVPELKGIAYSFKDNIINFSPVLLNLVQALHELEHEIIAKIELINVDNDIFKLYIMNKIPVYIGNSSELIEKFIILQSIIKKIIDEKINIEYIDLRIINKPVIKF